jgi:hypothetical protein
MQGNTQHRDSGQRIWIGLACSARVSCFLEHCVALRSARSRGMRSLREVDVGRRKPMPARDSMKFWCIVVAGSLALALYGCSTEDNAGG